MERKLEALEQVRSRRALSDQMGASAVEESHNPLSPAVLENKTGGISGQQMRPSLQLKGVLSILSPERGARGQGSASISTNLEHTKPSAHRNTDEAAVTISI